VAGVQEQANRDNVTNGVGFSVNGTRPRSNNFLIDGQDNNDTVSRASIPPDKRGSGSRSNCTHQLLQRGIRPRWWLSHNVIIRAAQTNFMVPRGTHRKLSTCRRSRTKWVRRLTTNPFDNENTFGFTFGGPIKKTKLFVFGTSQWDRERASAAAQTNTLLLPTDVGVATLQSWDPTPVSIS